MALVWIGVLAHVAFASVVAAVVDCCVHQLDVS